MGVIEDDWCHYSDMPSPLAYKNIDSEMTDSEIISRIIELESPIVQRVINDRSFKASDKDEYQSNREELEILREKVKHIIYPPSYLPDGKDPQRPNYEELNKWKENLDD